MTCGAIYNDGGPFVMNGAICELPAGHEGDHNCKTGVVASVVNRQTGERKIIHDGSQGFQWAQEAV